jgi:hypothetical protein
MAATITPPAKTEGAIVPESVSITLKNTGSTKVIVLGSTYAVTQMERVAGDEKPDLFAPYRSLAANPQVARLSAAVPQGTGEVVLQAGKVLPEFQVIEAGQEIQQRFIARVPATANRTLRLGVIMFTARGVRLRVGPKRLLKTDTPDVDVYVTAGLRDDSWLRDLIDGKERVVVVSYHPTDKWPVAIKARIIPASDAYHYPSDEVVDKYTSALAESLGLTQSYAFDEIPTMPRTKTPKPTPRAKPDPRTERRSPCRAGHRPH